MCNCNNIEIGSYNNQICTDIPSHMEEYRIYRLSNGLKPVICIDNCILKEIQYLWNLGIKTTGCCCGHNILDGFIGVVNEDIPKMKQLGYKVRVNEIRPNDEDSFYPRSVNKVKKNCNIIPLFGYEVFKYTWGSAIRESRTKKWTNAFILPDAQEIKLDSIDVEIHENGIEFK